MPIIRRIFLVLALSIGCAPAVGGQSLEIITLHHRSAEQLIPQLQPFVEHGGALSGMGDKLYVRASAPNLAQLRDLVAGMDTPVRRLMISLRSDGNAMDKDVGAAVQGAVGIGDGKVGAAGTARIYSSDRSRSDDINTQVQSIDGGRAVFHMGQSFLLPLRLVVFGPGGAIVSETLVRRDVGNGFTAVARLNGDAVTVEVSPQLETFDRRADEPLGVVESERLYTAVSGRLGEWMELAGAETSELAESGGAAHYGTRANVRQRRLLLKVDVLQ